MPTNDNWGPAIPEPIAPVPAPVAEIQPWGITATVIWVFMGSLFTLAVIGGIAHSDALLAVYVVECLAIWIPPLVGRLLESRQQKLIIWLSIAGGFTVGIAGFAALIVAIATKRPKRVMG